MTTSRSISVIIPSYNHQAYLEDAVSSCLNQDYRGKIEIIIVDDASSDETWRILDRIERIEKSQRSIRVLRKSRNLGVNHSISAGLKLASGEYTQILASDDILISDKFSRQERFLNESMFDAVYASCFVRKADGTECPVLLTRYRNAQAAGRALRFVSERDYEAPLLQSALIRTEALRAAHNLRVRFRNEDWALSIFLHRNYRVGFMNEQLFIYRMHENNSFTKINDTLPARLDVALNLVSGEHSIAAVRNIHVSHGLSLIEGGSYSSGIRFVLMSIFFGISSEFIRKIGQTGLSLFRKMICKN